MVTEQFRNHIYIYTHTHIYIHTHIYTYIIVSLSLAIYLYIYIYIRWFPNLLLILGKSEKTLAVTQTHYELGTK